MSKRVRNCTFRAGDDASYEPSRAFSGSSDQHLISVRRILPWSEKQPRRSPISCYAGHG